jgi:hypothetical protein
MCVTMKPRNEEAQAHIGLPSKKKKKKTAPPRAPLSNLRALNKVPMISYLPHKFFLLVFIENRGYGVEVFLRRCVKVGKRVQKFKEGHSVLLAIL